MSRTTLIALFALACASPLGAAEKKDKPDVPPAKEKELTYETLPARVHAAAKKQIRDGKVTSVAKVERNKKAAYDITFTDKEGKAHEIEVGESGSVIDVGQEKEKAEKAAAEKKKVDKKK